MNLSEQYRKSISREKYLLADLRLAPTIAESNRIKSEIDKARKNSERLRDEIRSADDAFMSQNNQFLGNSIYEEA